MKKSRLFIIAGVAVLGLVSPVAAFDAGTTEKGFHCTLTMEGEPKASVTLRLSKEGDRLGYTLEVKKVADITMAHLHVGTIGGISTPVAWLYPKFPPPKLIPGEFEGVLSQGEITAGDLIGPLRNQPLSVLIEKIRAGGVYVNIHTKEHAAGEICGPVQLADSSSSEHK